MASQKKTVVSTIFQLIITVNDFASTLRSRDQKQTDAILLDFSKAFDKLDHEGLLSKLNHLELGINGSLLNWARSRSFLVGREQRVWHPNCLFIFIFC